MDENLVSKSLFLIVIGLFAITIATQVSVMQIQGMVVGDSGSKVGFGNVDLDSVDVSSLQSTAHTIAAVFPLDEIHNSDDALRIMFPTGTPAYGEVLGVSYDDPVGSLAKLANMYRGLQNQVKTDNPAAFQKFINLAANPAGVSCEYCCGIGPAGADSNGNSRCGCQHNPALLSVALYLSNAGYTDGEVLHEVMKWKTLFFPRDMISLGLKTATGEVDLSSLGSQNLPGMVGGC